MKIVAILFILLLSNVTLSQNVQVDSQSYTPQQLIEDVLIGSDCISNISVTNTVGGDFNNTDQSYGFFDATGTSFPFERGLILSTGRLENAQGPNTSLSDDDAPNWIGDPDLENILNEPNTLNATIIEFEFSSMADQISFRYIFASEEYQENDPSTCQYSDLFGFLIRPVNQQQYINIALVPNTQIPVKVTTVHPEIINGCPAENEIYFGSWNPANAPINFNGQTAILTATANVIPNEIYHVKLVIADEQNYRYDSAVFLEAGSFLLSTNLGVDRLLSTNNPLCENETLELNAFHDGNTSYKWFKDGLELTNEINATFEVVDAGLYNVEVILDNNCISYGEITIEYANNPITFDSVLTECDINQDGLTIFNLFDASDDLTNNDGNLIVQDFFTSELDAFQNINPIVSPSYFENTSSNQILYARVENIYGCFKIEELQLAISNNILTISQYTACEDVIIDGFTSFNLNDLETQIQLQVPIGASVLFYLTLEDSYNDTNAISGIFENTVANTQEIYVKINYNNQCYVLSEIELQVLNSPVLEPNITQENPLYYCLNNFPETIALEAGVINDSPNNYTYEWSSGESSSIIEINMAGTYTVNVTHLNGCTSVRSVVVVNSNIATIEDVSVEDLISNNSITVTVSGEGNYEFALDNSNGPYQDSNFFENVQPGFRTVFVRDKNRCGIVEQIVSVLGFPKFFTPNNDTYNDYWQILGVSHQLLTVVEIFIFDRYGKLIKQIDPYGLGWNGKFNGSKLPTNDYWFLAKFSNGKEFRSHFALVR